MSLLVASTFHFKSYVSIEITHNNHLLCLERMAQCPQLRFAEVDVHEGSLQHYFPGHADVVFANCLCLELEASQCDPGVLLSLVFRLASTLLPGSFLLLLTAMEVGVAEDWGWRMQRVGQLLVCAGTAQECVLSIFVTSSCPT